MGAKAPKPLTGKALDREIERLYGKLASGRQINVLQIGPLFARARQAYSGGMALDLAVEYAIGLHCEPIAKGG
mgnify:CR=1 FL=1